MQPYVWLPQIDGTFKYGLPNNVGGSVNVDSNPSSYLQGLNFAGMVSAEVHYGRFSVIGDAVYVNLSNGSSHLKTGNFAAVPSNPVTAGADLNTSTRVAAGIWSLGAGYTLLQGDWGNLDAIAGFRALTISARTNYYGKVTFTGPRGGTATLFGPGGGLSDYGVIWNGVFGLRGRIRIGESGFAIPFYGDVGGGGSNPTFQLAAGVAYQTRWADLSLGWRYMKFQQDSSYTTRSLALNGPYLAASFRF